MNFFWNKTEKKSTSETYINEIKWGIFAIRYVNIKSTTALTKFILKKYRTFHHFFLYRKRYSMKLRWAEPVFLIIDLIELDLATMLHLSKIVLSTNFLLVPVKTNYLLGRYGISVADTLKRYELKVYRFEFSRKSTFTSFKKEVESSQVPFKSHSLN